MRLLSIVIRFNICTAIIGLDAHNNLDLENPTYYDRACQELNALKMPVIDTIPFLKY